MRLALIGPCEGDVAALARAARTSLLVLSADRTIYLGTDEALDAVAFAWAEAAGVLDPLEARVDELLEADAETIEAALEAERVRARLGSLHAVAGPNLRAIEILHDRMLLLVDDKKELDEEDLLPMSFIVFGRGEPVIRRVGSRVFFCPGSPARRTQGILLLDEGQAGGIVEASLHDVDGAIVQRETLDTARSVKMKVQGA